MTFQLNEVRFSLQSLSRLARKSGPTKIQTNDFSVHPYFLLS